MYKEISCRFIDLNSRDVLYLGPTIRFISSVCINMIEKEEYQNDGTKNFFWKCFWTLTFLVNLLLNASS